MTDPRKQRDPSTLWPDVGRLLRARGQFRSYGTADAASSVPAFLAWKAFLLVARGTDEGSEPSQCAKLIAQSLEACAELTPRAVTLATNLQDFRRVSPAVVQMWFVPDSVGAEQATAEVQGMLRRIRSLERFGELNGANGSRAAYTLGGICYAIRNAVLAHVNVLSTGNLFQRIVPPFEELVAAVAVAGWAKRAGVSLGDAKVFLKVNV